MKRKYLDEIGFVERPDMWGSDNKKRNADWQKEREKYGFDSRETWSMDVTFVCWLYERLKMFVEICNIDFTDEKMAEIKQKIDKMIQNCEEIFKINDIYDEKQQKLLDEILDLFKETLEYAPEGVIELIKEYAWRLPCNDLNKIHAIKEKTGFDAQLATQAMKPKEVTESAPVKQGRLRREEL